MQAISAIRSYRPGIKRRGNKHWAHHNHLPEGSSRSYPGRPTQSLVVFHFALPPCRGDTLFSLPADRQTAWQSLDSAAARQKGRDRRKVHTEVPGSTPFCACSSVRHPPWRLRRAEEKMAANCLDSLASLPSRLKQSRAPWVPQALWEKQKRRKEGQKTNVLGNDLFSVDSRACF